VSLYKTSLAQRRFFNNSRKEQLQLCSLVPAFHEDAAILVKDAARQWINRHGALLAFINGARITEWLSLGEMPRVYEVWQRLSTFCNASPMGSAATVSQPMPDYL
jgi:hypothetical protein